MTSFANAGNRRPARLVAPVALQVQYSLIQRIVESELVPMAAEMGLGVTPRSPLGNGVLTRKYSSTDVDEAATPAPATSRRSGAEAIGFINAHRL